MSSASWGNMDKSLTLCPHFWSSMWTHCPPPPVLQCPMHCFREIPLTLEWCEGGKKNTAWKVVSGNDVTAVESNGPQWTTPAPGPGGNKGNASAWDVLGCLENIARKSHFSSNAAGFSASIPVPLFQRPLKRGQMEHAGPGLWSKYSEVSWWAGPRMFSELQAPFCNTCCSYSTEGEKKTAPTLNVSANSIKGPSSLPDHLFN